MGTVKSRPAINTSSNVFVNNNNNAQPIGRSQSVPEGGQNLRALPPPRERGRYGLVHVKISSLSYANRRQSENETTVVISPRGGIFYGNATSPGLVQKALVNSGVPMLAPLEFPLSDSRANKLLVIHNTDDWYIIPSQEPFSRHSGTCVIIGDKKGSSGPYKIKLGDCFRLGSVGVVVSEVKTEFDTVEQRLDARKLQYLKDEAIAFDSEEDMAALAADEEMRWRQSTEVKPPNDILPPNENTEQKGLFVTTQENDMSNETMNNVPDTPSSVATMKSHYSPDKSNVPVPTGEGNTNYSRNNFNGPSDSVYGSGGITNGERFVCYMCYETHDTPADPLVAPCECKGDTRYLHVQCLQKWYHSSVAGPQARVIRTTGSGAPACKICGVAYKTTFKRPDGRKANLLEMECAGPYISLVVVTRHDTNPSLFNTKFRLNFGQIENDALQDNGFSNSLLIGRSSTCHMVLDYRTVSTVHAKITYEDGGFTIQDKDSSNGTMAYMQGPLPLKFSSSVRIRMGRTTMSFQPKRTWTAAIRSVLSTNFPMLVSPDTTRQSGSASVDRGSLVQPGTENRNRRSSSTGAMNPQHENNINNNSSRSRLSGSIDTFMTGNVANPRFLTAQELYVIMSESSPSVANSVHHCDSRHDDDLKQVIRSEGHEVTSHQRSVSTNDVTNVRRVLFDRESDPLPSNDVPSLGLGGTETEATVRRGASNTRSHQSTTSNENNRSGHISRLLTHPLGEDDACRSAPLSPSRDSRKISSIVVIGNQDHHRSFSEELEDPGVGTSYDLLLESSAMQPPLSPSRPTFDIDGAVTVPPARAFTSHGNNDNSSSRPSSRGVVITNSASE